MGPGDPEAPVPDLPQAQVSSPRIGMLTVRIDLDPRIEDRGSVSILDPLTQNGSRIEACNVRLV